MALVAALVAVALALLTLALMTTELVALVLVSMVPVVVALMAVAAGWALVAAAVAMAEMVPVGVTMVTVTLVVATPPAPTMTRRRAAPRLRVTKDLALMIRLSVPRDRSCAQNPQQTWNTLTFACQRNLVLLTLDQQPHAPLKEATMQRLEPLFLTMLHAHARPSLEPQTCRLLHWRPVSQARKPHNQLPFFHLRGLDAQEMRRALALAAIPMVPQVGLVRLTLTRALAVEL